LDSGRFLKGQKLFSSFPETGGVHAQLVGMIVCAAGRRDFPDSIDVEHFRTYHLMQYRMKKPTNPGRD
jgi:hypothetical protein